MNGSLASPTYRRYEPSPQLREFIEVVWLQESGPTPGALPTTIVPTGRVELILHYGDPYVQWLDDELQPMPMCHVVGQQKSPITLNATGSSGIAVVRFRPWGAFAFFGGLLAEISNQLVDLGLLWGRSRIDSLLCQLQTAATPRSRIQIVENFLWSRLAHADVDGLSLEAVKMINANWGRSRVADTAREFNLGRRQFNRRFTRSIGASPKQLSRVLRAQKAIACIRAGKNPHDVVDWCGYVDQSHLIREVVAHSNRRPSDLRFQSSSNADQYFNSTNVDDYCGTTYL